MLDYATLDETEIDENYLNSKTPPKKQRRPRRSKSTETPPSSLSSQNQNDRHDQQDSSGAQSEKAEYRWTKAEKRRLSGLSTVFSNVAAGLGLFGAMRNNEAYVKDAVVIQQRSEPLSEKWVLLCREYPELGIATDTFLKASPVGALLGEVVGLGLLIASNHGLSIPGLGG